MDPGPRPGEVSDHLDPKGGRHTSRLSSGTSLPCPAGTNTKRTRDGGFHSQHGLVQLVSRTRLSWVSAATSAFMVFPTMGAMRFLSPLSFTVRRNVNSVLPSRARR